MTPNRTSLQSRAVSALGRALLVAGLMSVACEGPIPADLESAAQPLATRYPLVCRGGVNSNSLFPLQLVQNFGDDGTAYNEFHFDRSPVSGNNSGAMPPGSCAWQDRPVAQSEPAMICLNGTSFVWEARSNYVFPYQAKANWISAGAPAPSDADLQGMIDLMFSDATRFRTFMVANDFGGCLRTR